MANIKGITIEIAGKTSPLVNSLKDADKALANTNSALKAVNKALELDPTNTELVAQKQELLKSAVDATKDRLNALKEAAELAAKGLEDGTTTKEQYAQLTAEIAITEASLKDLENGGKEAGKAAEESAVNWEKFGNVAAEAAKAAAAAVAAVGAAAVAAGKALIDCAVDGAAFADEFLTMSITTGVNTQTLQEWSYASELVDVSLDTMTGALTKTTRAISAYADGNASTVEALDSLGVAALDSSGNMRDSEDVFWDIIDALGEIDNETERDAMAMELLGKSAQDLNPLIEAGSDRMAELAEQAHEAGYVLDDETLGAFVEFDDQLQRMKTGTTAAKNALGTILLPVLTSLAGEGVDLLGEFTNAVLDADGDVTQISEIINTMVPEIINVIMEFLPTFIELAGSIISAIGTGLLDNIDIILNTAVDLLLGLCDGILAALPELVPVVMEIVVKITTELIKMLPQILAVGLDIILAIVNGLSDNIGELIPVCIDIIFQICDELLNHIDEIIIAAVELAVAIAIGLVEAIPQILERIPEIIDAILGAVAELGPQLYESALGWGGDLIDAFVSGVRNLLPNLVSCLTDVGNTIASYLHFTSPDVGPLAHDLIGKSGADMIATFADGMNAEIGTLEDALEYTGNTIAGTMTGTDYSGALAGISDGITALGAGERVINLYVGSDLLDSFVIGAINNNNFVTGAR